MGGEQLCTWVFLNAKPPQETTELQHDTTTHSTRSKRTRIQHPRRGTVCDLCAPPDHHITHTHTQLDYICNPNPTYRDIVVCRDHTGPLMMSNTEYQHPVCLNSRTPCSMCGGFICHFSNKMPIIHLHVHLRSAVSSINVTNVTPERAITTQKLGVDLTLPLQYDR